MRKTSEERNNRGIKKVVILLLVASIFSLGCRMIYKLYSKSVQADTMSFINKGVVVNKENASSNGNVEKEKNRIGDTLDGKDLNVNSDGRKHTYDAKKVSNILEGKGENDDEKIAFLTFDDGPSTTVTPKILDTLKEQNVKATFFLIGKNLESNEGSKELVNRIFNEGHALANHSYSHDLKTLYPGNKLNINCFMNEVEKTNTLIRNIVGQDFNTRVLRMPGGYMSRKYYKDPNLDEFDAKLIEKNMCSIDWNAYNADAEGKAKNASELLEEVKKSVGTKKKVVILMHDTYGKEQTAKALPQIIEYLKSQDYKFRTLT